MKKIFIDDTNFEVWEIWKDCKVLLFSFYAKIDLIIALKQRINGLKADCRNSYRTIENKYNALV